MKFQELNDKFVIIDEFVKITITKRNFTENIKYFSLKQIHSDIFYFIEKRDNKNFYYKGDAIITKLNDFPIGVRTADCLPIFLYSKEDKLISVIHSGWRSTAKRLLEKVLIFIKNDLNINLSSLKIIFGPCICEKCYEIKEDMKNAFIKDFGSEGKHFFKNNRFDLKASNKYLLSKFSIQENNIFDTDFCTFCNNDKFFSFRKEATENRIQNIIIMNTKFLQNSY